MSDASAMDAAGQLQAMADGLDELPDAVLLTAGHVAVAIIAARTKAGLDADGNPFKPYTKRYGAWRARKGLRSQPPDLAVTGLMLGALQPRVEGKECVVSFVARRESDKAGFLHEGTKRMDARPFVDIRRQDELDVIGEVLGEGFGAEIARRLEPR